MYIHNLYNDLMLSVSILFDRIIFGSSVINRYEFNLGNRTFQYGKDPKVNVDLPCAIVSVNDESASFGQRTETIKQLMSTGVNDIPVLFNRTNKKVLKLHEEHTSVPLSVTINTESQLHAKELSHIIKRFLPLNKYISHFKFTSFLEVDLEHIGLKDFNPYNHDIINLFSKFNNLIGKTDFCFSVRYQPMIRLESISASVPDSSQRSYQITIDLTYLMQWPMYLFFEDNYIIENINLHLTTGELYPISYLSTQQLFGDNSTKNYMFYNRNNHVEITDEFAYFTFELDSSYMDFSNHENQSYNLISITKDKYFYDITPYSLIAEENKIVFKLQKASFDTYLDPSVTNPIVFQVVHKKD